MLTLLEKAVIDKMLNKPGEHFQIIREQLAHSVVGRRELSGVGFFTHFTVSADAAVRHDLPDMEIGNVEAEFPALKHGAGFLLFVRGGVITMLEGYTYDEEWPENTDEFRLFGHEAV